MTKFQSISNSDKDQNISEDAKSPWQHLISTVIFQIVIIVLFILLPKVLGMLALLYGAFLAYYSLRFINEEGQHKVVLLVNAFNGFLIIVFGVALLIGSNALKAISLALIAFMLLATTVYKAITKKEMPLTSFISFVVTFATCGYMIYLIL